MSETGSETNGSGFEVIASKDINNDENLEKSMSSKEDVQEKLEDSKEEFNQIKDEVIMLKEQQTSSEISSALQESGLPISKLSGQLEDVKLNSSQDDSDLYNKPSFFLWLSSNNFFNKVAETAKNSMDSMITTLDPGMKEYLYTGGDVNIIVTSEKDSKVSAVREAFQDVFKRATVKGVESQSASIAAQPNGFEAAEKAAEERIFNLRTNHSKSIPQNQVIVAIESFIYETTPGSWYDISYILLDDPLAGIKLDIYTQSTPIPKVCVNQLKFETPSGYPLEKTGFFKTIGQAMSQYLKVNDDEWHQALTGIDQKKLNYQASFALANMYKYKLNR